MNSLLEMEGRPRVHHPLSSYLDMTKDKSGMLRSRLKIPYWSRQEPQPPVDLSDEDICIIGSTTVGLNNGLTVGDSRGTADGGLSENHTPDFTTTVIHQHVEDIVRSPADGRFYRQHTTLKIARKMKFVSAAKLLDFSLKVQSARYGCISCILSNFAGIYLAVLFASVKRP